MSTGGSSGTGCARAQLSSDLAVGEAAVALTLPWLVVQLKPRFLASRLQSKPLRCRIRAASAEGSESSCRETGSEL